MNCSSQHPVTVLQLVPLLNHVTSVALAICLACVQAVLQLVPLLNHVTSVALAICLACVQTVPPTPKNGNS
jgi:hypothetical protein